MGSVDMTSRLVRFSFVVEMQRRESSDIKNVGGRRGFSKQLPTGFPLHEFSLILLQATSELN